jgi:hypothetical protein
MAFGLSLSGRVGVVVTAAGRVVWAGWTLPRRRLSSPGAGEWLTAR